MIVYHGTSYGWADSLTQYGLVAQDGVGPFVTASESRAASFAARSVLCERLFDPNASTLAAMLVIDIADECRLKGDPWYPGDYLLPGGCAPEEVVEWRRFDAAEIVALADDEFRETAGLGMLWAFEGERDGAQLRFDCPVKCSQPVDYEHLPPAERRAWRETCRCASLAAGEQPARAARSGNVLRSAARPESPFENPHRVARGLSTSERQGRR